MSNNKQQTTVEWLETQIRDLIPNDIGSQLKFKNKIKQAKEMERQRMINFTEDWYFNGFPLDGGGGDVEETIEQYYNETYGGGEQ